MVFLQKTWAVWLEFDGTQLFRGATNIIGKIHQKSFTIRDTEQLEPFLKKIEPHLPIKQVGR